MSYLLPVVFALCATSTAGYAALAMRADKQELLNREGRADFEARLDRDDDLGDPFDNWIETIDHRAHESSAKVHAYRPIDVS